jgi:hypothetical protein
VPEALEAVSISALRFPLGVQVMNEAEQISKQLLSLLGRWSHELRDLKLNWCDWIVRRCCDSVEHLLRVCAATIVPLSIDAGVQACQSAGRWKSVTQMTTGELAELLASVDHELTVGQTGVAPSVKANESL